MSPQIAPMEALLPEWLRLCAGKRELVENYDRLRGTDLARRGKPIDMLIDDATGKFEADAVAFFEFCTDLFARMAWDDPAPAAVSE